MMTTGEEMMSQTDIFYFFSKDLCIYTSMLKLII